MLSDMLSDGHVSVLRGCLSPITYVEHLGDTESEVSPPLLGLSQEQRKSSNPLGLLVFSLV